MKKRPLIGVTFDVRGPGGYSQYPWYVLRENYCLAVANAGGIPFPLIHDLNLVEDYLSLIDGLLITGGEHDVDPALYGVQERHPTVLVKPQRTNFEMAITRAALEKNMPVLGICGGQQLINVALGGTLIQHIPDEHLESLDHNQGDIRHEPCHPVKILKNTMLDQIIGKEDLAVNSIHHQAVKDLGQGVAANAIASDGIIEGIEATKYKFCLGIQWHPEFNVSTQDASVFKAFIEATRG